jgi:2-polyprenyl-6-methoxyphenol hydroxylase-like FAD-dependent oxidoreductase
MVVGAGPAGLAVALMLAKKGWAVSVFERSSDPAAYDPGGGLLVMVVFM